MKSISIQGRAILTVAEHSYCSPEKLKKYYQHFCEYQILIDKMHDCMSSCNYNAVRTIAHRIKGGAAMIGAELLLDCATSIENAVAEEHFDKLSNLIESLKENYKTTADLFVRIINDDI